MSQAIIVDRYTFTPGSKTIVFTDYPSLRLEGIKLITNTTTGTIIFQFNDGAKNGTVSGSTLTLDYDTTSMASDDKLMIIYDPPTGGFFEGALFMLQRIVDALRLPDYCQAIVSGKALRVVFDANSALPTVPTIATVTTVTTLSTATNLTNLNTIDSRYVVWNGWQQNYIHGLRSKIN